MVNKKKRQRIRQSDNNANQSSVKEEIEKPQIVPSYPFPNKPTKPVTPEENPDPTRLEPGVNEPEKNDPTRIDVPPEIFNNK